MPWPRPHPPGRRVDRRPRRRHAAARDDRPGGFPGRRPSGGHLQTGRLEVVVVNSDCDRVGPHRRHRIRRRPASGGAQRRLGRREMGGVMSSCGRRCTDRPQRRLIRGSSPSVDGHPPRRRQSHRLEVRQVGLRVIRSAVSTRCRSRWFHAVVLSSHRYGREVCGRRARRSDGGDDEVQRWGRWRSRPWQSRICSRTAAGWVPTNWRSWAAASRCSWCSCSRPCCGDVPSRRSRPRPRPARDPDGARPSPPAASRPNRWCWIRSCA